MRFRLFALLFVPTLTVLILAAAVVADKGTEHSAALRAAESASIARKIALVDESLGVEALMGASTIGGDATWQDFTEIAAKTDIALAELRADAQGPDNAGLRAALAPVDSALGLRSDVVEGVVSPLQLLDRYTNVRSGLLTALTDRIAADSGAGVESLRNLIAVIEARSEHLNERLEIELAVTYQTWAPGLYSEYAASISLQDEYLAAAGDSTRDALQGTRSAELLQSYREQILLAPDVLDLSPDDYRAVSDDWIRELDLRIATDATAIDEEFAAAESDVRSQRNTTTGLVFLALLVTATVAGLVGYRIVTRLRVITERARLFASGELIESTPLPVSGSDEISELSGAFDHAVGQLAQRDVRLEEQARIDDLTRLHNRRTILEFWENVCGADDRAAACVIDLDNFKPINDEFGHLAGDEILRSLGERLLAFASRHGGRTGRLGGDEFLAVLVDLDRSDTRLDRALDELRSIFRTPVTIGENSFALSASIGVARSCLDGNALDLLREADEAMYVAKTGGSGQAVVSTESLRAELAETKRHRGVVVDALIGGRFFPWYQPIMSVDGDLLSFEALARMEREDGTVAAPVEFIGVLESEWLIDALDFHMFEQVCAQVVEWNDRDLIVDRVGVNFASATIERPDFADRIQGTIERSGCPPEQIMLELTESGLMSHIEQNADRLQSLRELGVWVAADDFGSGYSSLRYIRQLPIDAIKLDRAFIDGIEHEAPSQAIVRSVVGLGRDLRLRIIAEGIETGDEYDWLTSHDVHYLQGFLLGHPAPVEQAAELLQEWDVAEGHAA